MDYEDLYRQVGRNLAIRRRELKRTQLEIAEAAGISRPSLANMESGRQALTLHQVYNLAAVLELQDAKSLLPVGNAEVTKSADHSKINVKTPASGLNEKQLLQIKRAVASSTGRQ